MRRAALALLALAPLALAGCAGLDQLARAAFVEPRLAFKGASLEAVDFEGATLAFDVAVENDNAFGLSLAQLLYWIQVEGVVVARGQVEGGLSVPARGAAPVRFTARVAYRDVPRLVELVRTRDALAYQLGAEAGVSTPVGLVKLPVTHSGELPVPRLPAVRLGPVQFRLASLTEVELSVAVDVANPNPFPLPGGSLDSALAVGGEVVARTEEEAPGVAAGATGRLSIPVRISLLGATRAAAIALQGGRADVRVSGQLKLGWLATPVDLTGKASR